ncbi:retrotransposon-like protein 1 [Varicellaria rhodocarpa]|nr:retrotransposon-like protein 1 [Varicellaria rhodocarpa]
MGITDLFSDLYASLSFAELHAEAAPEQVEEAEGEDKAEGEEGKEESGESEEGGEDKEEGEEKEEEDADDEEEEEEEEPEDIKPKLEEECAHSAQCSSAKHHYDECAERVTAQHENPDHKGPKEDCVEEFFHLSHCATQCAAPKLFRMLK